jgi:hypothetical protein
MGDLVSELDGIGSASAESAAAARASDRPVASIPVARTVSALTEPPAPATKPPTQTTLGSASAEKIDVVTGHSMLVPARPSRAPILAVLGVVAAVGAVALWVKMHTPESGPVAATTAAPEPVRPPAPPPAAAPVPPPTPAPVSPPTPAPAIALAPVPAPAPPAPAPKPATASRKVKVVITSEPSGADVCLSRNHLLVGKTKLEWNADRSSRPTKLLLRKRGYRGQEIAVDTDRDTQKAVTLHKLGPDDLDDTDNCEQR